ncbi:DUF6602 domain-containing protein [uncultured Aeromicrobium sp.]|uniref:DUF6602 domain-containing protein n=1 Tax=uncultured Aeromicrobium sp. TaxID=337820 RepID=UPI0025F90329|nr:DUF6602 domain-containing protein [uncultured Aeromicrobium sp.]
MTKPSFDIAAAFRNKAVALRASFLAIRDVTAHPTERGDQGEADWAGLIRDFLPTRYAVGPIFAVDHHGNMSQQIDVAIYDTHYSPQWFGAASGTRFVPVESVYAVFEVKPEFTATYLEYARAKVASVRGLERTSQSVAHKGGLYKPEDIGVKPIIGGFLTTRQGLAKPIEKLVETQPSDGDEGFLNIGLCLDQVAFDYTPQMVGGDVQVTLDCREGEDALIHFCIRLFQQLQVIGTVPAVDMTKYESTVFPMPVDFDVELNG